MSRPCPRPHDRWQTSRRRPRTRNVSADSAEDGPALARPRREGRAGQRRTVCMQWSCQRMASQYPPARNKMRAICLQPPGGSTGGGAAGGKRATLMEGDPLPTKHIWITTIGLQQSKKKPVNKMICIFNHSYALYFWKQLGSLVLPFVFATIPAVLLSATRSGSPFGRPTQPTPPRQS